MRVDFIRRLSVSDLAASQFPNPLPRPAGISLSCGAMSIKRLSAEEKALYLIGKAVWNQFREVPRDPDTTREIVAVGN